MEREEIQKPKWKERTDPDAYPLTSFGRDDVFTDDLIKGICEKKDTKSLSSGRNTKSEAFQKKNIKPDEVPTIRKKRNTRKNRGIR